MLPASTFAEITTAIAGLGLEPNTAAAVFGAVIPVLLRAGTDHQQGPDHRDTGPSGPPRTQKQSQIKGDELRAGPNGPGPEPPQRTARRFRKNTKPPTGRKKAKRPRASAADPGGPRQRALAALKANPDKSLTAVAKAAGVSRSTVVNAAADLAAQARKAARKARKAAREPSREPSKPATKPAARRTRAQHFLRNTLAHGPKPVANVEDAAVKAHVDPQALEQARADLGIVASRANTGGVQAVQWSLPG